MPLIRAHETRARCHARRGQGFARVTVPDLGRLGRSRPEKTVSSPMHLLFYWESSTSAGGPLIGFGGPPHAHTGPSSPLLLGPPPPPEPGSRSRDRSADVKLCSGTWSQTAMPVTLCFLHACACPFPADWKIKFASTPCTQMASLSRSRHCSAVSATRRPPAP